MAKILPAKSCHNPYSQVLEGHHLSICPALRADRVRKSGLTVDPVGLSIRNASRPGFPQGKLIKKKKTNQKRKTMWKLPQSVEINKGCLRQFLLMISTTVWKTCAKTAQVFPQLPQDRRRRPSNTHTSISINDYKGLSECNERNPWFVLCRQTAPLQGCEERDPSQS